MPLRHGYYAAATDALIAAPAQRIRATHAAFRYDDAAAADTLPQSAAIYLSRLLRRCADDYAATQTPAAAITRRPPPRFLYVNNNNIGSFGPIIINNIGHNTVMGQW